MMSAQSIDLQPTLSDGRILLRPLHSGDWDALYAVASDPLIWAGHPISERWQERVFRQFFEEGLASGGALAITRADTGAIVGSSRYDRARAGDGEIEIGWTFLSRSEWGGTTNAAVKRLMIAHALQHFDRAIFLVGETNVRSRKAMEKIGGQLTDRVDRTQMGDREIVHVIYTIDRSGFARGPLQSPDRRSAPA